MNTIGLIRNKLCNFVNDRTELMGHETVICYVPIIRLSSSNFLSFLCPLYRQTGADYFEDKTIFQFLARADSKIYLTITAYYATTPHHLLAQTTLAYLFEKQRSPHYRSIFAKLRILSRGKRSAVACRKNPFQSRPFLVSSRPSNPILPLLAFYLDREHAG